MLLIHATTDQIVPNGQSGQMAARLRAATGPVELILLSTVDHSFIGGARNESRAASLRALNEAIAFLDRTLKRCSDGRRIGRLETARPMIGRGQ